MSKILLLNPPGKELYLRDQHCNSVSKTNYYWPPIDLIMLSGVLSEKHQIKVIDAIIENINTELCLERIVEYNPDFIIFLTGFVSWKEDFHFMKEVKSSTNSIIIASGGFVREDFHRVMEKYEFLDCILMDYTSSSILDYIDGKRNELTDMCIRLENKIVLKPSSNLKEFTVPVPLHELFPLDKYRLPHNVYSPFASVLTNYGCPYQCSFCIGSKIDFKYRPVDNVMAELEKIYSMGIREIFFKNFTFGVPRNVTIELCKEIKEKLPKLSWICSSRVNVVDEDMIRLMKEAGCHTIQFGVESGSQELLDENKKQITLDQIEYVFKICHKNKIRTLAHFILGLPGDTESAILETVNLSKRLKCDYVSFNIATPTYGTDLRKICIENKWINEEDDEFDSSKGYPVIETPGLSKERVWELRNYAIRSFYLRPSYIFRKLIGVRSFNEFIVLFREGFSLLSTVLTSSFQK